MKLLVFLALVGLVVARPDDFFNFDPAAFQEAKDNVRLLGGYADCLLGEGPCTKEGTELKQLIPNAVNDSCGKCSAKDKMYAATLLKAVQTKLADKFEAVVKLYDPNDERRPELNQFMSQHAS